MTVITERQLIRHVAKAWATQYAGSADTEKQEIGRHLAALNGKTASADQVAQIIGNRSWTQLRCDECGQMVPWVVQVGEEDDYESRTATLCRACVRQAAKLIRACAAVARKGKS